MEKTKIIVGMGSCGIASGGKKVYHAIEEEIRKNALSEKVVLSKTGCLGMCYREPLVEVVGEGIVGRVVYGDVTPEVVARIFKEHIIPGSKGKCVSEFAIVGDHLRTKDTEFLERQTRIILRNCGRIDPESIESFISAGGYVALKKIRETKMSPDAVIAEISGSGLRGRGGAGFPTGTKWKFVRAAPGQQKYVVCNGDEGDPGAFMDRVILESDPHSVIEGMIIAAYAIGATRGYAYIREEYPLAVERFKLALEQARSAGFLGEGAGFDVEIKKGAGAFVCGEETALIASIEGRRGMPRLKPPFPANSGLWEKPTCINNVKTLASVPWVIVQGASEFAKYGTEKSKGTAVFSMTGSVVRGGLVEVPMGTPLNTIVFDICGGVKAGHSLKAIQTGGPSGGCIPAFLGGTGVDYEALTQTGSIMGSGGMVVLDDTNCMVDIARFFLNFTQAESCGKCTFCRIGTRRMLEILTRICDGKGSEEDITLLESLTYAIKVGSLCGLGQTAPNPALTTIKYFRSEYEAHVRDKKCPAHRCRALLSYSIRADKCIGCTACVRVCPVKAIAGKPKTVHVLDGKLCIKCGACRSACKFNAVEVD